MTVGEFKQMVMDMTMARMGPAYIDYLAQQGRDDKYLREEYLPILAILESKRIADSVSIELGNNKNMPDAIVGATYRIEITQALPIEEHIIRKGGVTKHNYVDEETGKEEEVVRENRGIITGADAFTYFIHSGDHLQFPRVVIEAIERKHDKIYQEPRALAVVVDGDYSFESDNVICTWIDEVRLKTKKGAFVEILLVERDRRKVFRIF